MCLCKRIPKGNRAVYGREGKLTDSSFHSRSERFVSERCEKSRSTPPDLTRGCRKTLKGVVPVIRYLRR